MNKLKIPLLVVIFTILIQLVADHIMRSTLNGASYLFIASVAGASGLLALLLVNLIFRRGSGYKESLEAQALYAISLAVKAGSSRSSSASG